MTVTTPEEAPQKATFWLVEGDDHETRTVEATTRAKALTSAHEAFREQYGRYAKHLLEVVAAFTGNPDGDTEDWEYLAELSTMAEASARSQLEW